MVLAAIGQGAISPLALDFGIFGLFIFGAFPIWAVFSLTHYNEWERFDGFKFAATHACFLGLIIIAVSVVFRPVS